MVGNGNGNLGELLIYNSALSDLEILKIETYLSEKWGVNLPSNAKRYNLGAKDSSKNDYHGVLRKTFSPSDLSNNNLWLDASDSASITHSSNAVSQWNDKSGNNYHATAPSGGEPTTGSASINGKNVLTWASGKRMNRSTPTSANWQDVYVVAQWTGGSSFSSSSHPGIFGGSINAGGQEGAVLNSSSGNTMWTGWINNRYLNGSLINGGTILMPTMASPFLLSFSSDNAVSVNGILIGQDR